MSDMEPRGDKRGLWSTVAQRSQEFGWIAASLVIGWGILWALFSDQIRDVANRFLAGEDAPKCVVIPPTGHYIEGAAPGKWATVTWVNINRVSDCGAPALTGVVVNGDGVYHDSDLNIRGVKLDTGITPEVRYRFRVPDEAEPGRAWFRVTMDFHEEARSINSPRIPFVIERPRPAIAPGASR